MKPLKPSTSKPYFMKVQKIKMKGLLIIEPEVFKDDRGYFFESFNKKAYHDAGINYHWVQDNQSKSKYGVIRGLHYQLKPKAQAKLVRVLYGRIYDIALDIRQDSQTYGKWFGLEISSDNNIQFVIPAGFAHGFSVLSEEAVVLYKCDELYDSGSERGIIFNDPALGIDWKILQDKIIISEKDLFLPRFSDAEMNF